MDTVKGPSEQARRLLKVKTTAILKSGSSPASLQVGKVKSEERDYPQIARI